MQSCCLVACGGALVAYLPHMLRYPVTPRSWLSCAGPNRGIQDSIGVVEYCHCQKTSQTDRSRPSLALQEAIAKHGFQDQKWVAKSSLHTSSWVEDSAYILPRLVVMPVCHARF